MGQLPKRFDATVRTWLVVPCLIVAVAPASFLFRRGRDTAEERYEAFDQILSLNESIYEAAAMLKPHWQRRWHARHEIELPPRFDPRNFTHPAAENAAKSLRFGSRLLHQNRWASQVQPLFAEIDHRAWSNMRSTLAHSSVTLVAIQDQYGDALRTDESGWVDGAVEQLHQTRRYLSRANHSDEPEVVSQTTFRTVYVAVQLSTQILDRMRQDAAES